MNNRRIYEETHNTRPSGVGKVTARVGSRYNLILSDGKELLSVGCFAGFKFEVGMCVTYHHRGGVHQIIQPAPHGF